MLLLTDENFDSESTTLLRKEGHDVLSITELFPQILDISIVHLANAENRTILTHDRDFGTLIFRDTERPRGGVVYFRLREFELGEPAEIFLKFLKEGMQFESRITVIKKDSVRQKIY